MTTPIEDFETRITQTVARSDEARVVEMREQDAEMERRIGGIVPGARRSRGSFPAAARWSESRPVSAACGAGCDEPLVEGPGFALRPAGMARGV